MIAGGSGGDGGGGNGGGGHSITCGGGGGDDTSWHGLSHSAHIVHGTWSFAIDEVAFLLVENAINTRISKKCNELAMLF